MDVDEIKALIEAMSASDLTEMQVEKDGWLLRLSRGSAAPMASRPADRSAQPPRADEETVHAPPRRKDEVPAVDAGIRSPLAGVVYFSPSPDLPSFVEPGATVQAGDIVCLVEAMKMFNEVRADRAGTVEAFLAEPGAEVDAGQLLVRIV